MSSCELELVMERLPGLKGNFSTILADPPWQFQNRTGKVAPEHKRLKRYHTMTLEQILAMPVGEHAKEKSHLYLWVPNALLEEGYPEDQAIRIAMARAKQWAFHRGICDDIPEGGDPDHDH